MFRRLVLPAVAAVAALAISATPAFAISSVQKFEASASPTKAGTKAKPTPVALKLRPHIDDTSPDAASPQATDTAVVLFPKGGIWNGKLFPTCAATKVETSASSCPRGSKIGSGTAAGEALGLTERLTVQIYNGGAAKVVILVDGSTPLQIHRAIEGKIEKQTGKYSYKLTVDVPSDLEQPAPGAIATLTDFNVTVPKKTIRKGRKVIPLIASTGCPGGSWPWAYTATYTDGTQQTVEVNQSCT